jgi:ABC-2 type transport system permease protein
MGVGALIALVRKDLLLLFSDRRAVILTFALPIAIASFFGSIFGGSGNDSTAPARIPIAFVDRDGSAISKGILAGLLAERSVAVSTPSLEEARAAVQTGDVAVAVIVPRGFGDAAGRAFLMQGSRPQVELLFDPSRSGELAMVRGMLTGQAIEAVGAEVFGGAQGRAIVDETLGQLDTTGVPPEMQSALRNYLQSVQQLNQQSEALGGGVGITVPFGVKEDAVIAGGIGAQYNGYAHSFAGMGIQFLLFAAIELGIGILLERELGIWKRFRSAPLSRFTLLAARAASGTIITLLTLVVSFAFAMIVFGVRIHGSVIGFAAIAVACSIMAATFGLLVAALGRTPAATRRVATFAVLVMVMLGGAWVPSFIFPAWLQQITVVIPARWAVDGLDAMTWRGLGIDAAIVPTLVLLGFSVLFAAITVARFRWEEA